MVRTARSFNATMPQYVVDRAKEILGDLTGLRVVVLGASYRGKVRKPLSLACSPRFDALRAAGAQVLVQDPMYTDEELEGFGWQPYHLGENVDVAIVQADHPEYSKLTPADLPGVRLLLDGRRVTNPALFVGVPRITIGGWRVNADSYRLCGLLRGADNAPWPRAGSVNGLARGQRPVYVCAAGPGGGEPGPGGLRGGRDSLVSPL